MIDSTSPDRSSEITVAQVRAARALLAWSQRDLANKAGVATSTVADFERGFRTPIPGSLGAMRTALEAGGVVLAPGGVLAEAASLRVAGPKLRPGAPLRWITATDLAQWGGTRKGQDTTPELVSRLLRASAGSAVHLHFPSQDSVSLPGWDGLCEIETGTEFIPSGRSVWEIGTQRERIASKADGDYRKRTDRTDPGERSETTFVFVTPQRWTGKAKWLKEKQARREWMDVRAYDADVLVHWLELHPVVGHWLASLAGKRPPGLRRLDEAWKEWSFSTEKPIGAGLVLAGRDEEGARTLRWLREDRGLLSVQADSPDEALAFLHAVIDSLPTAHRETYLSRAFVASAEQARALKDSMSPLLLVLDHPDPGLAKTLAERHHIYVPYGPDFGAVRDTLVLPRPFRHDVEAALVESGVGRAEAHKLARASGRSATVIRRLMPAAPGVPTPDWAKRENAGVVLPALLAGAWDEGRQGDRDVLQRLGKAGYVEVEARLSAWTSGPDSPLRKVGSAWKVASPRDAWLRLAPHLPPSDFRIFTDVAVEVLKTPDPRFDVPPEDRWVASLRGIEPRHSGLLKAGLAEMLALISVQGGAASNIPGAARHAEGVVRAVLERADGRLWWSLSPQLRTLAEAAPDAFLDAVQEALDSDDSPVMALFSRDEGVSGGARHSDLLWALKCLAWSADHLPRVARILARLAKLDPDGRCANHPLRSLRHVFVLWSPQTAAPLDQRMKVLDALRRQEPEQAWRLLLELVPKGHDAADSSPLPRWRDFADNAPEGVTYAEVLEGAETVVGWVLEDVGTNAARWQQVLDLLPQLPAARRGQAIRQLECAIVAMQDATDRLDLLKKLRHVIQHHREFCDTDWAMPAGQVDELERVHDLLAPADPVEKAVWMFEDPWRVGLLRPNGHDWEADGREAEAQRQRTVEALIRKHGPGVIDRLVRKVAHPGLVGSAVAQSACSDHEKQAVLLDALRSDDDAAVKLARSLIGARHRRDGEEWADALLALAPEEGWPPRTLARILVSLPFNGATWRRAATSGHEVEAGYWATVCPFSQELDVDEVVFATGKLLDAGRARTAVGFLGHVKIPVESGLLVKVLEAAARGPNLEKVGDSDAVMGQYNIERILQRLDNAGDLSVVDLARLEWNYLPLLRHSSRGLRTLHEAMTREPAFFVQVLSMLYRPDPKDDVEAEPMMGDVEQAEARASRAFELLQSWTRVPGVDGTAVDGDAIEAWVEEARLQCGRAARLDIGDQQIGRMLAHAPPAEDGFWPAVAVRKLIETTRSRHLELGIEMGLHDKRGVTIRDPHDGGSLERVEAVRYRNGSRATKLEWPRTSALLARVAESYESQGRYIDDDVERRDWSS